MKDWQFFFYQNTIISHGKLYMANLALLSKVYRDVGISYASPLGAKTLLSFNLLQNS